MITRCRMATILCVVGVLMTGTPVALAGDPPPVGAALASTGAPIMTPEEQVQYDLKHKLAEDYLRVRSGLLDAAMFAKEWAAVVGPDIAIPALSGDGPEPISVLSLTEYAQKNEYYCGPATAREILGYRGVTEGPDGESLTQKDVAHNPSGDCEQGYLCTTSSSGTAWYYSDAYPRPMKTTLNTWIGLSFYIVHTGSAGYESAVVMDIDAHFPIAMLVRELANQNTPHLVGHPKNTTIGHWIAVHGYDDYGVWSYYADPVHGTSFWSWSPDVPAHSWIASGQDGLSYMMDHPGTAGYIW
jgi:hypothetical protein